MCGPDSGWLTLDLGARVVYACPRELPGKSAADAQAFKNAYLAVHRS